MRQSQPKNSPLGLMMSMVISVACIIIVFALRYSNAIPSFSRSGGDQPQTQSGSKEAQGLGGTMGPSQYDINTTAQPIRATGDLRKIVENIVIQSTEQLHKWQVRNQEAVFQPELIVPKYFKTFYGDMITMKKD